MEFKNVLTALLDMIRHDQTWSSLVGWAICIHFCSSNHDILYLLYFLPTGGWPPRLQRHITQLQFATCKYQWALWTHIINPPCSCSIDLHTITVSRINNGQSAHSDVAATCCAYGDIVSMKVMNTTIMQALAAPLFVIYYLFAHLSIQLPLPNSLGGMYRQLIHGGSYNGPVYARKSRPLGVESIFVLMCNLRRKVTDIGHDSALGQFGDGEFYLVPE